MWWLERPAPGRHSAQSLTNSFDGTRNKNKIGKEKGDIVKTVSIITLQELKGSVLIDADKIYQTEIVGFFTGNVKTIQGYRYDEVVLAGTIKSDGSPDFSQPKYYYPEGMLVSFVANPDYDYSSGSEVSIETKKSFDWLRSINNVINTIGTVLGLIKRKTKRSLILNQTIQR